MQFKNYWAYIIITWAQGIRRKYAGAIPYAYKFVQWKNKVFLKRCKKCRE